MEAPPLPAFLTISVLYVINMLLAFIGYRRLLRLRPNDVAWSIVAYGVGSAGTALMTVGLLGDSLALGLATSIGGLLLMIGLVFGLQLCFMRIDLDPPDDRPPVDEPDVPPVFYQPRSPSPRHRRRRVRAQRKQRHTQPTLILRS